MNAIEGCDDTQQFEAVHNEARKLAGRIRHQGSWTRQQPFPCGGILSKIVPTQELVPLSQRCHTQAAQDGEKESSTDGRLHLLRKRPYIGSGLPREIRVGMRCMRNPLRSCNVTTQTIFQGTWQGSSNWASDVNELRKRIIGWCNEISFRHHTVSPQALFHEWQYSETGHGDAQPLTRMVAPGKIFKWTVDEDTEQCIVECWKNLNALLLKGATNLVRKPLSSALLYAQKSL